MVNYDKGPGGYKQYQERFSNRKVGVANHGIPDLEDEVRGLVNDIQGVPWETLSNNEKVAVSNIAVDCANMICLVAVNEGKLRGREVAKIMKHISMLLLHETNEVEDPFDGMGLEMVLANEIDDLEFE